MTKSFTTHNYWNGILNASLCKFFILRAICAGQAHGYELIRRVSTMTDGFCCPTEGTIYPILREFLECGCVTCHEDEVNGRVRKVYAITPKGREAFKAGKEVWGKGMCCVQRAVDEDV